MSFALMMLGGMALDLLLGWPGWLYARIGHPVTWLGHAITALERRWNHGARPRRLALGALAVALIVALAVLPALAIQSALPDSLAGSLIGAALAWPLIAMRAMHAHVAAVATPLARGDLAAARAAVAMIVGRDPAQLDAAGIARAATESLAENTSDGIIAPLFWGAIAGLPGIAGYKAINTLDSMIGHRNERFEAFGKAAARLDDVVNWLPARLTGALFAIASGRHALRGLRVMWRDAPKHRSPNAGWPEGAMAAALNIRLSGPRVYGTRVAKEPWLNGSAPDPAAGDLTRALRLYRRSMALCALALAAMILLRCAA
ncbi:adenosylcobinamide-phosphate synthase CbiB [Alloyangia pacifica]|uniref:adenosylcobinamide-phosphate synthase CbiB n=1 Tax=Alloyangia pacifica TaxID=311180 RepID=UPI001CD1F7AB|nr:adenosylcobinamide-phosphate synthase CbiB [Alloyangia pacifica]MCA0996221.1 adenosylcobinamide-phosphate synthase CbiB [Alloyangia pacifica]